LQAAKAAAAKKAQEDGAAAQKKVCVIKWLLCCWERWSFWQVTLVPKAADVAAAKKAQDEAAAAAVAQKKVRERWFFVSVDALDFETLKIFQAGWTSADYVAFSVESWYLGSNLWGSCAPPRASVWAFSAGNQRNTA
jgi:hypothetical protein